MFFFVFFFLMLFGLKDTAFTSTFPDPQDLGMPENKEENQVLRPFLAHPRSLYGMSDKTTSGLFPLPSNFNPPHPHLCIPVSAASWIMRKLAFGIAGALARMAEKVSK